MKWEVQEEEETGEKDQEEDVVGDEGKEEE